MNLKINKTDPPLVNLNDEKEPAEEDEKEEEVEEHEEEEMPQDDEEPETHDENDVNIDLHEANVKLASPKKTRKVIKKKIKIKINQFIEIFQ